MTPGTAPTTDPAIDRLDSINVLGVAVSDLDMARAVRLVSAAVRTRTRGYICICGAHGVVECQADPALQRVFNGAMAVTPDGMPLVWALRGAGHAQAGRVYGPDLMRNMLDTGRTAGLRHFLYGTTPATLAKLTAQIGRRYPGAIIAGSYAPPFRPLTPDEERHVADVINGAAADIVWVGLSTPKQDRWMAAMRDRLEAPVLIGVGAAFDFLAGNTRSAPPVLQRAGLEWAFRLATEPRRLWRRYVRIVPLYLMLRGLQRAGLRQFPIQWPTPSTPPQGVDAADPAATT